jgi:hypothetical protein
MHVGRLLSELQFNWWGSWQEASVLVDKIMSMYCSVVICVSVIQIRYGWLTGSFGLLLLLLWFILNFMISWAKQWNTLLCEHTLWRHIYFILVIQSELWQVSLQIEYSCLLQDAQSYLWLYIIHGGTQWCSWLRHLLQAGRSRVWFPMVSLEFFIDTILLVALCPWGWLIL